MQKLLDPYQAKLCGLEKSYSRTDHVTFICKCGNEATKAHRDIIRSGAYCKQCQKENKSKKISEARSMKDVLTDEATQRRCSQCKHVRDLSSYRHAQSDTVETSLCERCRRLKRVRDSKYREERKKEEVTDPDQQKCTHCFHIRDKDKFRDGNKVCNRCTTHARTLYAKMKTAAETMNNAKGATKMCVRCWKIDSAEYFITDTGHSGVVCMECTDMIHAAKNDFRQVYLSYKQSRGACVDCGESDTRVLDFDHVDRESKLLQVSSCRSFEQLKSEAEKCEMRCVLCHTRRSKEQLNYGSSTDKWRKQKRDHVNEIKRSSNGCEECGWFDPSLLEALEFDHLDPNSKNTNIGTMVAEWAFTLDDIDYEIEMCRLVCRKCHRIHSLTQREEYWAELRSQ
jgi:hypothetical protein